MDLHPHDIALSRCTLRIVDLGPRDTASTQRPLLLVHGGHGGWRHWQSNLDALAREHRVVAPDMPGFGDSTDLPGAGIEALADVLDELAETLQLGAVGVAGFSFGTLVATALATRRPERVARLLLVNPPGLGVRSPEVIRVQKEISELAKRSGSRAGIEQTMRRLLVADPSRIDDAVIDAALAMAKQMRFFTRDLSRGANLLPQLAALKQPLKVLIGEQDPHQRHEAAERIARIDAARGAGTALLVPGAAHWLQHDRADAFNDCLLRFMREG
jgi:pimeloyl-ACP methyl ester carboxylesterase